MSDPQQQDRRFKEAYAKELANALLQNEQYQKDSLTSPSHSFTKQELDDAYLALCYDDPLLKNDLMCRELAVELLGCFPGSRPLGRDADTDRDVQLSKLGLSDRFVNGCLLTTSNSRSQVKSKSAAGDGEYTTPYNGEPIVSSPSASTGYAELGFVVFVLGPLLSCNNLTQKNEGGASSSSNFKSIQSFLGTYNGKGTNEKKTQDSAWHGQEDATKEFLRNMAEMALPEGTVLDLVHEEKKDSKQEQIRIDDNHDDSMKEIFAAESDSDDYDYGGDRYSYSTNEGNTFGRGPNQFQSLIASFDTKTLSQSKLLTLEEIKHRIQSLLAELTYRRVTMGSKAWKEWDVSKTLVDLTLRLLECLGHNELDSVGMMYSNPLMALRDRAMDESYGHDALDAYLDLIRKLLGSQTNDVGEFASTNRDANGELSPARAIGLSSLAGLCSSLHLGGSTQKKQKVKIRSMIMECLDELIDCAEFIRPKKNTNGVDTLPSSSLPAWVRVTMALSPIIDFVTGVKSRADCSPNGDPQSSPLLNTEAQSMLQSGLIRSLILLYAYTQSLEEGEKKVMTTAKDVVREQLLRSIFILSAQSTNLGKYTARVPELTSILYSDSFHQNNTVDSILWYSVLSNILSTNKGPQLRMKGVVSMSSNELKEKCLSGSLKLCDDCVNAMVEGANHVSVLYDLLRFTNFFHQVPYVAECWAAAVSVDGDTKTIQNAITRIISGLPKIQATAGQKVEGHREEKQKYPRGALDASTIASIRKGCKSLLLNLGSVGSSKLPSMRISSKTD